MNLTAVDKSFYFLRHGETEWNRKHIYMGQSDIPLNDVGIKQAHAAAEILKKRNDIHNIISSPLVRALKTAEIISSVIDRPISIIEGFGEASWGIKEGVSKLDSSWVDIWRSGGYVDGVEPCAKFIERVKLALETVFAAVPSNVLIVAHGGVYWAIEQILSLAKEEEVFHLKNCIPIWVAPDSNNILKWKAEELKTLY